MDEMGFWGMNFFNTRQYCDSFRDVKLFAYKITFFMDLTCGKV